MARILIADYGRDDLLALGSPLASILRAWGHEVVEAEHGLDVIAKARAVRPDVVIVYDTLPEVERLRTALHQQATALPVLLLHEQVQQMLFTDMVMVDPRYRLHRSPRHFAIQELQRLLDAAGVPRSDTSGRRAAESA